MLINGCGECWAELVSYCDNWSTKQCSGQYISCAKRAFSFPLCSSSRSRTSMSDGEDDFDKLLNKMEGKYSNKTSLKTKQSEVPALKKEHSEKYVSQYSCVKDEFTQLNCKIISMFMCQYILIFLAFLELKLDVATWTRLSVTFCQVMKKTTTNPS